MSTRRLSGSTIRPRTLSAENVPPVVPWVRNPSWTALTAVGSSEQRFRGLVAVFPQASYLALSAAGNYTVDWGDGTSENVNTNVTALKLYDFSAAGLVNTNIPVTLTDSGDLVERTDNTAHGYSNGMEVRFYNIVTTTGLTAAQVYYVINATTNNFQVSATVGGSAVALTNNGSATLLPYKIAIVNVTPQAGQNLTSINLNVKHTATNLQTYESGWLDIELSGPNLTALTLGGTSNNIGFAMCERAAIRNIGSVTTFASLFNGFRELQQLILSGTAAVTNMSSMFNDCNQLQTVPLFNTAAVTNMNLMFNNCFSLQSVPLFNTAAVTNMSEMFRGCRSLQTVPLLNTAAVTNMSFMFFGCSSLQTVPLFNTAAVTNMSSMFTTCSSLQSVPLFNTAAVTNMSEMFSNCSSLQSVPLFNTAAVTNMSFMFFGCSSLQTVPLFNTAAVTDMNNMFRSCSSLSAVPLFNTAAVTNMSEMFRDCFSLQTIPLFNTAAATNIRLIFNNCLSLQSIPALNVSAVSSATNLQSIFGSGSISRIEAKEFKFAFSVAGCKLGKTQLEEIFTNLPTVTTTTTITISNNVGVGGSSSNPAISTTTVAQNTTATMASTTNLAVGMMVEGTGTGITSGITVTSSTTADTFTLNGHGLPNGTPVAFSTLGATTGNPTILERTIYYVVNTQANTFQIATTVGGAAIDLTGSPDSNINVRYANYITAITPNTNITVNTPMAISGTNSLTYRTVDSASARLKNWAVTF